MVPEKMRKRFIMNFVMEMECFLFTEQEIQEQTGIREGKGVYIDLEKRKFQRVCENIEEINKEAEGKLKVSIVKGTNVIHVQNLNPKKGS